MGAFNKYLIFEQSSAVLESIGSEAFDTRYIFSGICADFNGTNENNRLYDKDDYLKHVEYLKKEIADGTLLGELDHPLEGYMVSMKNVSHRILDIWYDEDDNVVKIKIELLPTESGKKAMAIADSGVPLHISSRASGYIDNRNKVTIDTIYTFDIVYKPGFKNARLSRLNESLKLGYDSNLVAIYEWSQIEASHINHNKNNQQPMGRNRFSTRNIDENKIVSYLNLLSNAINEQARQIASIQRSAEAGKSPALLERKVEKLIKYSNAQTQRINEQQQLLDKLKGYSNVQTKAINESMATVEKLKNYSNLIARTVNEGISGTRSMATTVEKLKNYSNLIARTTNRILESADIDLDTEFVYENEGMVPRESVLQIADTLGVNNPEAADAVISLLGERDSVAEIDLQDVLSEYGSVHLLNSVSESEDEEGEEWLDAQADELVDMVPGSTAGELMEFRRNFIKGVKRRRLNENRKADRIGRKIVAAILEAKKGKGRGKGRKLYEEDENPELAGLEKDLEDLQQDLEDLKDDDNASEKDVKEIEAEVKDTEAKIAEIEAEDASEGARIRRAKRKARKILNEAKACKRKIKEEAGSDKDAKEKIDDLNDEIGELEASGVDADDSSITDLQDEIDELEAELEDTSENRRIIKNFKNRVKILESRTKPRASRKMRLVESVDTRKSRHHQKTVSRVLGKASIMEAKSKRENLSVQYPFISQVSDESAAIFENMNDVSRRMVKGKLASAKGRISQRVVEEAIAAVDKQSAAINIVNGIPQDLLPIWESLSSASQQKLIGASRVKQLGSPYAIEMFWRSQLVKGVGTVRLDESRKHYRQPDVTDDISVLGYGDDFIDKVLG